jgi:SRSO17 transposase
LSVQGVSTEASDSIALSCWASTPRCANLNAETAAVTQQDQPLRDRVDDPGRESLNAEAGRLVVGEDGDRKRHREHDQPQQQPIIRPRAERG